MSHGPFVPGAYRRTGWPEDDTCQRCGYVIGSEEYGTDAPPCLPVYIQTMSEDKFDVHYDWNPNKVLVRGQGQHVQVTSRNGEVKAFMIEDAIAVARQCMTWERELSTREAPIYVRLRRFWGDNGHGNARAYIQVIASADVLDKLDKAKVAFGGTTRNSQSLDVKIRHQPELVFSDRFEPNAEAFYDVDTDAAWR
jgi:hypothetical protein